MRDYADPGERQHATVSSTLGIVPYPCSFMPTIEMLLEIMGLEIREENGLFQDIDTLVWRSGKKGGN